MGIIKSNMWLNVINTNLTSTLQDPWLFEIPVNFKPTFMNMEIDWMIISFSDFHNADGWNTQMFNHAFGNNLNSPIFDITRVDSNGPLH